MALQVWLPLIGSHLNKGVCYEPTWSTTAGYASAGKIGNQSLSSGAAYLTAAQAASILNNNEFSFACWVYVNADTGDTSKRYMYFGTSGMGANNNRKFSIFQYPTVNDVHLSWMNDAASTTYIATVYSGVVPSRTWTHIAVTYKNPNGCVYINGNQIATFSGVSSSSSFAYQTPMFENAGGNKYLQDYRIYNHCLSATEVKEIAKGLVLHYKLDGSSRPLNKNIVGMARYNESASSGWGAHRGASTRVALDSSAPVPWRQGTKLIVTYDTSLGSGGGCGFSCGQFDTPGSTAYCYSLYVQAPDDMASLSPNWLYRYEYNSSGTQQIEQGVAATSRAQSLGNHWYRVWGTFTTQANTTRTSFYFFTYPNKTITYYFCCPQVELGSALTPWNDGNFGGMIADSSGHGYNSTLNGTVSVSSDTARYPYAAHFGAYNTPYTTLDNASFLSVLTNCTITYWCRHDNTSNSLSFTGQDTSHYVMATNSSSNYYHQNAGTITVYRDGVAGSYKSIANEWHFLALTGVNLSSWTQFKINSYGSGWPLNAYISDVRIYATALSADNIKELYKTEAKIAKYNDLHTYMFLEDNKKSISKKGIISCQSIYCSASSSTLKYDKTVYTEPDGSKWVHIFHHNNPTDYKFSNSSVWKDGVYVDANRWFDIYGNVGLAPKYELMLKQKTTSSATEVKYRWIQSVSPLIAVYDDVKPASVTRITTSGYTDGTFGGLYILNSSTHMVIANTSNGNWFGAIGCWTAYNGGIPGYPNTTVTSGYMDLYIRVYPGVRVLKNYGITAAYLVEM